MQALKQTLTLGLPLVTAKKIQLVPCCFVGREGRTCTRDQFPKILWVVIKMPLTSYKCHNVIACNCMGLRSISGFPTLERPGVWYGFQELGIVWKLCNPQTLQKIGTLLVVQHVQSKFHCAIYGAVKLAKHANTYHSYTIWKRWWLSQILATSCSLFISNPVEVQFLETLATAFPTCRVSAKQSNTTMYYHRRLTKRANFS